MKSSPTLTFGRYNIRTIISYYFALTKPGITFLVMVSMGVGFILGSHDGISLAVLFHALLGTFLIAGGTAAHNQYIERELDKKMVRTLSRPLPSNHLKPGQALFFSLFMMISGFLYLFFIVNELAGLISGLTSLLYLALYTPLKRISFTNVMVGAVPGALPPVGGWAAASASLSDPIPWILFLIVFLWQVPHVVSIAWLCDEDYKKAGFRMLPGFDTHGYVSSLTITLCLALLLPVSYLLYHLGVNHILFLGGAVALGLLFLLSGIRFQISRTRDNARKVLYGSLLYLPGIWILILLDFFLFGTA
ncbi:heme o synthase [Balneolaceae bacterium ANBcel3]|nr:heme o synthase [Balneolaceae bacterium ANBcel3]